MIRVFSMTLPAHEANLDPKKALEIWADDYKKGLDPIGDFLDKAEKAVAFAITEKFADPEKLAVGGLSRGGFIAFHLAARDKRFKSIVAFAPMTQLGKTKEFASFHYHPSLSHLALEKIVDSISNRRIRIYISNSDNRVDTKCCIDFAMELVKKAEQQSIRSPQIELFIYPPVGFMGHGTSPHIFEDGAKWIAECLQ
jgi:esterase FrsA